MPLQARHPLEPALHHALRDALDGGLQSTDFFVWIDVRPTGVSDAFTDLDRIVNETQSWLAHLDPDTGLNPDHVAERWDHDPAAEIKLQAIPKKPEARGYRSKPIVGNPEPILAGWGEG